MNNSSLFFEILMYLNSYFFGGFAVCELFFIVFKMVNLPYPNRNIVLELMITLLLCYIEYARIFLGRKGNFTEKVAPLVMSLFLTVPSTLGVVYLMLWQTYVLRPEIVLCCIQLCMVSVETVLNLINIGTFYKYSNY
ncbi:transmembrane protein 216-like [Lycorma delicatula]|uniref:transmembrane protein 216-like n=1 Tax=Lycorma delicatula TaxID=130591 RepID=UPI003F513C74